MGQFVRQVFKEDRIMSTQLQTPFAILAARRAKYSPRNNAGKMLQKLKRPLNEGTPDTGLKCQGVAPDFSPVERVLNPEALAI
jgi:hypothetical protein